MVKKKILFISHSAGLDGAERCLLDLLKGLDRDRCEALVLFPKEGPLRKIVTSIGWESFIFDMPWWVACNQRSRWHFRKVFMGIGPRVISLRKLIKEKHISLVYTNTITCIDGAIAARMEGIPHVWHIHEILSGHTGLKPYVPSGVMRLLVGLLSDRIIVPSNAASREIKGPNSRHKIRMIYNGVDFKQFTPTDPTAVSEDLRIELGIAKDKKIIALIGAFLEIKGQADFVEAAKIVSNRMQNTAFVLVGRDKGAYADFVKKRAKELGLDGPVYFLGFREDIDRIMPCIDILVSASWVECFPRVLLEGMAAGKPVVATRCGGPEEIVVDGETGYLVPIKDPTRLANAIIELLADENAAKEMGRKGRQRVEEFFNTEHYVKSIEDVIAEMCRC